MNLWLHFKRYFAADVAAGAAGAGAATAVRTAPPASAAELVAAALMVLSRLDHAGGAAPLDEGVRGLQSIYSAMLAPAVPEPEPASNLEQCVINVVAHTHALDLLCA